MKTIKNYFAFLAVFALLFSSCSKEDTPVVVDPVSEDVAVIALGPVLNDMLKSVQTKQQETPACSDDAPAFAQISLIYGAGNTPIDVVVPILSDENGLFTAYDDALEIPVAMGETTVSVTLNSFFVWNDVGGNPGEIIWAAPQTGSDYADFVSQSLPFSWNLRAGSKTYTNVDVICFDDREVNLYGYQFFDLTPIEVHEFCVFANYCSDAGRHYTANYTFSVDYIGDAPDGDFNIHTGLSPMTGNTEDDNSGEWYADPLCVKIPKPIYGEGMDVPYIRVTATLADWDANYPTPAEAEVITADLSWNDLQSFFVDGDTMNYWHIFFNCDDDGNGGGEPLDSDDDGIIDSLDNCPNTPNTDQADFDDDGKGDVCDADDDNDGINDVDENAGCEFNPDTTCGETGGVDPCIPDAPDGCTQSGISTITSVVGAFPVDAAYASLSVTARESGQVTVSLAVFAGFEVSEVQVYIPSLEIIMCQTIEDLAGGTVTITDASIPDADFDIEIVANYCSSN